MPHSSLGTDARELSYSTFYISYIVRNERYVICKVSSYSTKFSTYHRITSRLWSMPASSTVISNIAVDCCGPVEDVLLGVNMIYDTA